MKLHTLLDKKSNTWDSPPSACLLHNDCAIGIEIELEGIDFYNDTIGKHLVYWNVVEEHSIREGLELVFNSPMKGKRIISALEEFDSYQIEFEESLGYPPIISDRCSLHVHVDVRDMEMKAIRTFSLLYALYEKILFQLTSPARYKNNYCIPIVDSDFINVSQRIPYSTNESYRYIDEISSIFRSKYGALNMLATTTHGSLEFRGHPGTLDTDDIILWVNILLCLRNKAVLLGEKGIDINELKCADFNMFTNDIFGKISNHILLSDNSLSNFNFCRSWVLEYLLDFELKEQTVKYFNKIEKEPIFTINEKTKEAMKCAGM